MDSCAAINHEARIMNYLLKAALFTSLFLAAHASFGCEYPERVLIPNGNAATKEEMIDGQRGVKKYVADMEVYLQCIVDEEKQAREALGELQPEQEKEREDLLNKKYNAAVDEMERVAAQFNAEVQAYKAQESS